MNGVFISFLITSLLECVSKSVTRNPHVPSQVISCAPLPLIFQQSYTYQNMDFARQGGQLALASSYYDLSDQPAPPEIDLLRTGILRKDAGSAGLEREYR